MFNKIKRVFKIKSSLILRNLSEGLDYAFNHKQKLQDTLIDVSDFLKIRNDKLELIDDVLSCDAVIFSKDRAIQLHALLDSYFKLVKNPIKPFVLYTYSSQDHKESYLELEKMYDGKVSFIYETSFRTQLINLVDGLQSEKIFFMTDDGVFVDEFDMNDFIKFNPLKAVVNFARGMNCDYCYTYSSIQKIPTNLNIPQISDKQYLTWIWKDNIDSPGFSYPLSLDGALFNRVEVYNIFKNLQFKAPNTLEGIMQVYLPLFENRLGIAFHKVKYINVPINLVQTETKNINTGLMSIPFLLDKWNTNYQIDYDRYKDMDYKSIQLSPYIFKKR